MYEIIEHLLFDRINASEWFDFIDSNPQFLQ